MKNLIKLFYYSIYILLILSVFQNKSFAQAPYRVFAITPAAQQWLNYYTYWIPYDSSETAYTIGEFQLSNGHNNTWINLSNSIPFNKIIYGDTNRGYHAELAQYSNSQSFTYNPNSFLSFFRLLVDSTYNRHSGWDITDTVRFLVYLIRDSDNLKIATLDSVGSFARTSSYSNDSRFGTQYNMSVLNRPLPNKYAGSLVHIGITPGWWGTDQVYCSCCDGNGNNGNIGLPMMLQSAIMNYSAYYDSFGNLTVNYDSMSLWSTLKYNQIIHYCDSIKNATGCLPIGLLPFDSLSQSNNFYTRYALNPVIYTFNNVIDTFYEDTNCENYMNSQNNQIVLNKTINTKNNNYNIHLNNNLSISKIWLNDLQNSINISLNSKLNLNNISIALTSIDGRNVGRAWNGNISIGINSISVNLPTFPSDAYILYIISQGVIIGSSKFIITR